MSAGEDISAQLAEIAGGVKLIDAKLDASNKIQDERHDRLRADITDIRETQHRHSNRIGILEADNHLRKGERAGFVASGKLLHTLVGGGILGIAAILVKLWGLG